MAADNIGVITEEVGAANMKAVGGQAAFLMGLAEQNAVANQQLAQSNATAHANRINGIMEMVMGAIANQLTQLTPEESESQKNILTGDKVAELEAKLGGVAAMLQSLGKIAGTQPPVTVEGLK